MLEDDAHPGIVLSDFFLWVLLLLDFCFLYLLLGFLLLALLLVLLATLVAHDVGFYLLQMVPVVGLQCQSNLHFFFKMGR